LIYGGEGLARLPSDDHGSGKAAFVPFVLPGEIVEAVLREEKPGFARARLDEILTASPRRIDPRCPYFELMFIVGVLIVASATALEVGTSRIDTSRGGYENFIQPGASETGFFFAKNRLHAFARQHKRYKDRLAGAVIVGRKPCQTFAAID